MKLYSLAIVFTASVRAQYGDYGEPTDGTSYYYDELDGDDSQYDSYGGRSKKNPNRNKNKNANKNKDAVPDPYAATSTGGAAYTGNIGATYTGNNGGAYTGGISGGYGGGTSGGMTGGTTGTTGGTTATGTTGGSLEISSGNNVGGTTTGGALEFGGNNISGNTSNGALEVSGTTKDITQGSSGGSVESCQTLITKLVTTVEPIMEMLQAAPPTMVTQAARTLAETHLAMPTVEIPVAPTKRRRPMPA